MKTRIIILSILLSALASAAERPLPQTGISNEKISYPIFLRNALEVEALREGRRLDENQFLQMMKEPGVILLDARSPAKFKLRHIQGAVNLSLPDFTESDLARIIPAKHTKVLIYCNNNFEGSPVSFASKTIGAALNLHTFVALHAYGYTNVFELGPLLKVNTTRLPFAGAEATR
jgi:phage shock protein E